MAQLDKYGEMIVATTAALRTFFGNELVSATVYSAPPSALPVPVDSPLVNLFLYSDDLLQYGLGTDPTDYRRTIGAELNYLVTVHTANPLDPESEAQLIHGRARSALENKPLLEVKLTDGEKLRATLSTSPLAIHDLSSIWLAAGKTMQFGFALKVAFPIGWTPPPGPPPTD